MLFFIRVILHFVMTAVRAVLKIFTSSLFRPDFFAATLLTVLDLYMLCLHVSDMNLCGWKLLGDSKRKENLRTDGLEEEVIHLDNSPQMNIDLLLWLLWHVSQSK